MKHYLLTPTNAARRAGLFMALFFFLWWAGSVLEASGTPTQLKITGLRQFYSSPYLLDFTFAIRDQNDHAVILNPLDFQVECLENGLEISKTETGYRLLSGDNKQLKCFVVLDYTFSMLDLDYNGDSNGDWKSDAVEAMEAGAKLLIGTLHADAQIGLFEFHRADAGYPPRKIADLITEKAPLTNQIDQLYTNVWLTSGSTRCWDALDLALREFPDSNPQDDQRFLVFLSDGKDESSTHTPSQIISLAQTKGVKIYCIGYGQELTAANLQNITSQSGGFYYPAGSVAEMAQRFEQIVTDLGGQYTLRWATLKRDSTSFTPSFELTYAGVTTAFTANPYNPSANQGDELQGRLSFDTSLSDQGATLVLRANYIPRNVSQIRLEFTAAYPFTVERIAYDAGGVCPANWSFNVYQTNGLGSLEFSSPIPGNPFTALPFATLGKFLILKFPGVTNLTQCFFDLAVDNSIYPSGGASFVIDNINAVSSPLTELPHGTPIAWLNQYGFTNGLVLVEIGDQDGDGVPTWQEYLAGTNPTNMASAFKLLDPVPGLSGWEITFGTESNRIYRLDYAEVLNTWQTLQAGILGSGQPKAVMDSATRAQRFYRAVITGVTNPPPPNMVLIPAGSFTMGNTFSEGGSDERPTHTVSVSAFYMDQYEVTKDLWDEVKTWASANGYSFDNAGAGKAANHPVQTVNWYDVVKWCNARSEKEGRVPAYYTDSTQTQVYRSGQVDIQNSWVKWDSGYRLPTEAEWEKAARGILSGKRFPWGDTISHSQANYNSSSSYFYDVSSTRGFHPDYDSGDYPWTSPVGSFAVNGYGLYDLAGNVWEWCWDWYGDSYYGSSPGTDPRGPTSGSDRVIRGGCWGYYAWGCRVADRDPINPDNERNDFGFRSVLPPGQ